MFSYKPNNGQFLPTNICVQKRRGSYTKKNLSVDEYMECMDKSRVYPIRRTIPDAKIASVIESIKENFPDKDIKEFPVILEYKNIFMLGMRSYVEFLDHK